MPALTCYVYVILPLASKSSFKFKALQEKNLMSKNNKYYCKEDLSFKGENYSMAGSSLHNSFSLLICKYIKRLKELCREEPALSLIHI